MTETNKQPTTEAGRSMVEMLGVLAVIGVLSIGGIAGYNLGMEKQRANELLEASLQRAYTVSAQILSGRNASLLEFNKDTKKAGGTFQEDVEEQYLGEIGIKIHAVNQNVCKALVRSITDTSPLRGIAFTGTKPDITEADCQESNDLTLYYNESMSLAGDIDFTDSTCKDVECDEGLTCNNGNCVCTTNNEPMCNNECCPTGHTCNRGDNGVDYGCISIQSDSECLSNDECDEGEYCHITATKDETLTSCFTDMSGTCKSNADITYPTEITEGQIEGLSESLRQEINASFGSTSKMNLLSAENWCASHGRSLFSKADFNCNYLGGYVETDIGKCCLNGVQPCLIDITTQTPAMQAFRTAYNNTGYYWLNTSPSACHAYRVYMATGEILKSIKLTSIAPNKALCK